MGVFICNAVMACSLLIDFVVVGELQHQTVNPTIVTSDKPSKTQALSNTREINSEASYGE